MPPLPPLSPGYGLSYVVKQSYVLQGTVLTFDEAAFTTALASALSVDAATITLNVTAGSVHVDASIATSTPAQSSTVQYTLETVHAGGASAATSALGGGFVVEQLAAPTTEVVAILRRRPRRRRPRPRLRRPRPRRPRPRRRPRRRRPPAHCNVLPDIMPTECPWFIPAAAGGGGLVAIILLLCVCVCCCRERFAKYRCCRLCCCCCGKPRTASTRAARLLRRRAELQSWPRRLPRPRRLVEQDIALTRNSAAVDRAQSRNLRAARARPVVRRHPDQHHPARRPRRAAPLPQSVQPAAPFVQPAAPCATGGAFVQPVRGPPRPRRRAPIEGDEHGGSGDVAGDETAAMATSILAEHRGNVESIRAEHKSIKARLREYEMAFEQQHGRKPRKKKDWARV